MKGMLISFTTVLVILFCIDSSYGQNPKAKHSSQEVYNFFAQYTPEDIVEYAHQAIKHFSPVAKIAMASPKVREEELFDKALEEFNNLPLKFKWDMYPFIPAIVPHRCDQARVLAHPVKQFFGMMSQNGFLNKYKDVKGKKVFTFLCKKTENRPEGSWSTQFQWWPETDKPLNMGFFMINIPNTPYQIHTFYPTNRYSEKELNQNLKTGNERQ